MFAATNEPLAYPAPVAGDLQVIIDRVQKIRAALGSTTDDLTATRDRVFGSPPEALARDGGATAGGFGDLGQLNVALELLEGEVARLSGLAPIFGRL